MFSDFSTKSSSYISIDPVVSIQRVDPYRTSSQSWTNDSIKSSYRGSGENSHKYDYASTTIPDKYHDHSNNIFPPIRPYHESLDYPQYSLTGNIKQDSYTNMHSVEKKDESIKQNVPYWHKLDQKDYPYALGSTKLSERRPFQDLTNRPTNYALPSHSDFKSQAFKMEPSYREEEDKLLIERLLRREDIKVNEGANIVPEQFPIKEADMTYYSRPVAYNIEPEQIRRVSYSRETYEMASRIENLYTNSELKVNLIVGKKKGKSVSLIKRNRPQLDIDTSYNSNGHAMVIPADDGMELKNLMHNDGYTTRAGFLELTRR